MKDIVNMDQLWFLMKFRMSLVCIKLEREMFGKGGKKVRFKCGLSGEEGC